MLRDKCNENEQDFHKEDYKICPTDIKDLNIWRVTSLKA